MLEVLIETLERWNKTKNERQKLQHTFIVLSIVVVVLAGLVSLVNDDIGHAVLLVALVSFAAFCVNAIVWNLLQSSLIDKLSTKPKK